MNISSVEQAELAKDHLIAQLQARQTPMSLKELGLTASSKSELSNRTLKEAAWRLVEEGRAKFNSTWDLEIL